MTTEQVRARTKDVTRRLGWTNATPGERLILVEKAQGLRKDEPRVRLAEVEIVSVRRERLDAITEQDVAREGFPALTPAEFVELFRRQDPKRITGATEVTRIEWRYLENTNRPH